MPHPELPAACLYSRPSLGRLWKKVHLACSPFLQRPALQRIYRLPSPRLRKHFGRHPYSVLALGCADGIKESLLLQKLPSPAVLLTADTNPSLARQAAIRLAARKKIWRKIDLTHELPASLSRALQPALFIPTLKTHKLPILITLFGVLPNLTPLPLLKRIARFLRPEDLFLFSANLAPGTKGHSGALRVLPQYDNPPTREWLEAAVAQFRPRLPKGRLEFGIFSDPQQKSLARIEARWISQRKTFTVFSSRRPTSSQVEAWIRTARLRKVARYLDPLGEEGVWIVARKA
jgi:SAM-dependent methyltransferase